MANNFNYINIIVNDGENEKESQSKFMFSNVSEMERTAEFIVNQYASKYNVPFISLSNSSPDIKTFQIKYKKKSITVSMHYGYEQSKDIMRFIKETINI